MPNVRDVLGRKRGDLVTLSPGASVLEAAELMNARGVGAVLVMDGGRLAGIFTERDVLRRVVAAQRSPAGTTLEDVMTHGVVTCELQTSVAECAATMSARRIRHLPVMDADGVCGMVSIGDLLALQVDEQQGTIAELNRYIYDLR